MAKPKKSSKSKSRAAAEAHEVEVERSFDMEPMRRAILKEHRIEDQASSLYPGVYYRYGFEQGWSLKKLAKQIQIKIINHNKTEMEFDMIGVDPAIANCFRRIMLSEVPSMAIEKVFMYNNTSVIPDEVLAHRLGLIPIKADPRMFEYREEGEDTSTEQDTLEYRLRVKCRWNPRRLPNASNPDEMYLNHKVYSGHIKWTPVGGQKDIFGPQDVGPVQKDILIAKLRPGHEIDLVLHAVKGIGKDHSKFSPAATVFYRLLPEITLKRDIVGEQAERLQKCFSPGVIKLVETTAEDAKGRKITQKVAKVHNARYDSCSRNVLRYKDLADAVELSRVKDHFIFTVESAGALPPDALFVESVKVLMGKCKKFLLEINKSK